jgi:hypothetical protein
MDRIESIEALRQAIRESHGCDSRWVESVWVYASSVGKKTWSGSVEVFALEGHPDTRLAYAWREGDGGEVRVVLHAPSVGSPAAAVRSVAFG